METTTTTQFAITIPGSTVEATRQTVEPGTSAFTIMAAATARRESLRKARKGL